MDVVARIAFLMFSLLVFEAYCIRLILHALVTDLIVYDDERLFSLFLPFIPLPFPSPSFPFHFSFLPFSLSLPARRLNSLRFWYLFLP